jgi:hypothetical protein
MDLYRNLLNRKSAAHRPRQDLAPAGPSGGRPVQDLAGVCNQEPITDR